MVLGLVPKLPDIIGRLNTNNLSFPCEFAWFFLQICCNHPDMPCDLVYALRTLWYLSIYTNVSVAIRRCSGA